MRARVHRCHTGFCAEFYARLSSGVVEIPCNYTHFVYESRVGGRSSPVL